MSTEVSTVTREAIELHDSRIVRIHRDTNFVTVVLSPCCVHRSTRIPGVDLGTIWSQDALVEVLDCESYYGKAPPLPAALMEGRLTLGTETLENVIPIPLDFDGAARLFMTFVGGSELVVHGRRLRLSLMGNPNYVEEFPGSAS